MRRMLALAAVLSATGCVRVLDWSTGAKRLGAAQVGAATVIDLRAAADFEAGHAPGASRVPFGDLNGYLHGVRKAGDPRLVLACEDGIDAALAAPLARVHGFSQAFVLEGGMAAWRAAGLPLEKGPSPPIQAAPPVLEMSRAAQWLNAISGLVLKPTYMLLALAMVIGLRRARSVRILWHGLLWFFVGEAFCALNLAWHLPGRVYLSDVAHGAGMVAMSALIPWGLYAIFDERVLRFSDPSAGCRLQTLCGQCWKRDPVRCGFHDLMLALLVALAIVSAIPFSSELRPLQFVADVLGVRTDFGVPVINLLVELRVYPALAIAAFVATFAILVRGGTAAVRRATPVFFAAFGLMAYSLLRFFLTETFREAFHGSNFWEELTELFMIVALGLFLWLFRRPLGLVGTPPEPVT